MDIKKKVNEAVLGLVFLAVMAVFLSLVVGCGRPNNGNAKAEYCGLEPCPIAPSQPAESGPICGESHKERGVNLYAGDSAVFYDKNLSADLERFGKDVQFWYFYPPDKVTSGANSVLDSFITPPLSSGVLEGTTLELVVRKGVVAGPVDCPFLVVYPRYQLFVVLDVQGQQVSSDKDYSGNVTARRGINFEIARGGQASFSGFVRNRLGPAVQNACDYQICLSSPGITYVPFISPEQSDLLDKGLTWKILNEKADLPTGAAPPDPRVPVSTEIDTSWGDISFSPRATFSPYSNQNQPLSFSLNVSPTILPGTYNYIIVIYDPQTNPDGGLGAFAPTEIPVTVVVD